MMMGRKAVFSFFLKAEQRKHDGPTFYILYIPIIFIKRTYTEKLFCILYTK